MAAAHRKPDNRFMTVILLEALAALVLLLLIVWWTMFSGRKKGELPDQHQQPGEDPGKNARSGAGDAPDQTRTPDA